MPSRSSIAADTGIEESRLPWLEDQGLVPRFGTAEEDVYRACVELIAAADRGGLSGQRIRRGIESIRTPRVLSAREENQGANGGEG